MSKEAAAKAFVKHLELRNGLVIGVGTGSTSLIALQLIAEKAKFENVSVICLPSSEIARELVVAAGLEIGDFSEFSEIDIAFDGADEVDCALNCLKSTGGVFTQEKLVAYNAKKFVFIGDSGKKSAKLGQNYKKGVAVEVLPAAYVPISKQLIKLGAKKVELRHAQSKAGPVVTYHKNFILDADFGEIENPKKLSEQIISIPGVLEHSIFAGLAKEAYFGNEDGTVDVVSV
jgi:ribose 5-phosphate isomerase A